jgi:hypothetical protein
MAKGQDLKHPESLAIHILRAREIYMHEAN